MENLQHFSHKHPLVFHKEKQPNQNLRCDGCDSTISTGPFYSCRDCDFDLHKSCTDLPFEILSHPFHPGHPLFLSYWATKWKCNKCNDESFSGFKYSCYRCEFTLDLKCAFFASVSSLTTLEPDMTASHFLHEESHPLIVKDMSKSIECLKQTSSCNFCNLPFSDNNSIGYFCVSCDFFVHKSCADQVHNETIENFGCHPGHPLNPVISKSDVACTACKAKFKGIGYYCKSCSFYFHTQCAKLQLPRLKHKRHKEHDLFYFINNDANTRFICNVCYFNCEGSFYRCAICDFNIHFECIPLPKSVEVFKDHIHRPLTLADGNAVSDVTYICCKKPRNPDLKIYYSKDCGHGADINCVMEEEGKSLKVGLYMGSNHEEATKLHFSHKHPLTLFPEKQDGDQGLHCNGCDEIIPAGPFYSCRRCNFNLHESCYGLPFEIFHRFHKKHPLFLSYYDSTWACTKCDESTLGFKYHCYRCQYTLDLVCAKSTAPIFERKMTAIFHALHEEHPLILLKLTEHPFQRCSACRLPFSGENSLAYCCLSCVFYLHESCAKEIQMTIKKEEFHPGCSLTALISNTFVQCAVCKIKFKGIAYCCALCNFYIHVDCSKLQFTISFKYKRHPKHQLYYFTNYQAERITCDVCFFKCKGSFYRCVICDFSIHFECISLPQTVLKYKHHKHGPLNFVDGHVESDGSGFHYCASCEEERNPEHHIYFCEDCPFEVDINCLLEEEGKTLEVGSYMVPKHGTASVQHFSHRHRLAPIDEGEVQQQYCSGCSKIIRGPAYCCRECNFYLHKSCYDMPFEISHPFHRKHSLFLSYWTGTWKCGSGKCSNDQNAGFAYYCYRCEFTLGLKCALQVPKYWTEPVQHFSHRHLLAAVDEELIQGELCSGCSSIIRGPAYCCRECNFYLHKSCYDMPFEISHPFHRKHPLFLSYWTGTWKCGSGKCSNDQNAGFAYYCYRCEFTLGLKCASQVPKYWTDPVQHFSHRHLLVAIDQELIQGELCNGCSSIIRGPAYCCRECNFYLHKSCYDMPFEISHPFHRKHSLFLSYWTGTWKCGSGKCSNDRNAGFAYYCYRCEFTLGLKCASQVLKQHGEGKRSDSNFSRLQYSEGSTEEQKLEENLDFHHHKEPTVAELLDIIRGLQLKLKATKEELDAIKRIQQDASNP